MLSVSTAIMGECFWRERGGRGFEGGFGGVLDGFWGMGFEGDFGWVLDGFGGVWGGFWGGFWGGVGGGFGGFGRGFGGFWGGFGGRGFGGFWVFFLGVVWVLGGVLGGGGFGGGGGLVGRGFGGGEGGLGPRASRGLIWDLSLEGRGLSKLSVWSPRRFGLIYLNSVCQLFRQIS